MTQASGERSVAIGGGVSNSTIVTGDLIQIVSESVRRLRVDYAGSIENFLLQYLGDAQHPVPFGGRDAALRDLDAWLDTPDQPYALLTAPAGRGKSALLVRWLDKLRARRPEEWKIVFVPVSVRYGTNLASVTFAALVAQLAQVFGEVPSSDPNTPDAVWRALFGDYLKRPPPQGRLLVVLDGLDEAANWDVDAGLFPARPPAGLKVIVSARLTANRPRPDDWRRALGWERPPARCFDLAPLDRTGLRDVLEKMGAPLDALAEQSPIVEALYRLTEGDPLLVSLYAGDLWQRGEGVRRLCVEDLHNLRPGYAGYFEGWWEAQRKLWEDKNNKSPLLEPAVRETLNLLSAALAPLRAGDLLALASPALRMDSWLLEESRRPLARFVVETGEGYVFAHPRLGAYFWEEKLNEDERQKLEARFLAWGRRVLDGLAAGRVAPRDAPPYLVRSYRAHLERAGAPMADLRRLVETHAWAQAWDALEGGFGGYLSDVQAVWRRAVQEDRQATTRNEPAPWLGLEARCALIEASIHSLAANLPPELPALLVRRGHWTPRQALAYVRQMPNEGRRAETLAQLLPCLPDELLAEVLGAAREIKDASARARVLIALAERMPEVWSEALDTARKIEWESDRAKALTALADRMPAERLRDALAAAREIQDASGRAQVLTALAERMPEVWLEVLSTVKESKDGNALLIYAATDLAAWVPEEMLPKVLAAAREIIGTEDRVRAMTALAERMPEVWSEALAAAREIIGAEDRVRAMTALAERMPDVWSVVLAEAAEISSIQRRTEVLTTLVARMPVEQLPEVLDAAMKLNGDSWRADVLVALATRMSVEQLNQVLAAAREIRDPSQRVRVLTALATPEALLEALEAEEEIFDISTRLPGHQRISDLKAIERIHAVALSHVLVALAKQMPAEQLHDVLAEARKIQDSESRALVLTTLAERMPAEQLQELLAAVRETESEYWRAKSLSALTDRLTAELLPQALTVAQEINSIPDYARVLCAFANRLPEKLLPDLLAAEQKMKWRFWSVESLIALVSRIPTQRLSDALAVASQVWDAYRRAQVLAALTKRMPEVCPQALDAVREIQDTYDRAQVLVALAEQMLPEQLPPLLVTAREIPGSEHRVPVLTALAKRMPAERLHELLSAAREVEQAEPRARVLTALAQRLAALPRQQAYPAWAEALPALARRTRKELLSDLRALAPLIYALGGEQAAGEAFRAVRDVGTWWP